MLSQEAAKILSNVAFPLLSGIVTFCSVERWVLNIYILREVRSPGAFPKHQITLVCLWNITSSLENSVGGLLMTPYYLLLKWISIIVSSAVFPQIDIIFPLWKFSPFIRKYIVSTWGHTKSQVLHVDTFTEISRAWCRQNLPHECFWPYWSRAFLLYTIKCLYAFLFLTTSLISLLRIKCEYYNCFL